MTKPRLVIALGNAGVAVTWMKTPPEPAKTERRSMNPNEFLARELMGWSVLGNYYFIYIDEGMESVCAVEDWNPLENIAQAFEVVEKMIEKGWLYDLGRALIEGHECLFFMCDIEKSYRWEHKNPATAITLAACKALKGEGG